MTPILTAEQMRDVDRRTVELGLPSMILMENAGQRVVDAIAERYSPLTQHHVAIFCGKGNNGGDGLVIARQLFTRFKPKSLHVVVLDPGMDTSMLQAAGCPLTRDFPQNATLVIDAILGTGLKGAAEGLALTAIRHINDNYASAKVVAVDIPSGLPSDSGTPIEGAEHVRADLTVTLTAPKPAHVLGPSCYLMGDLVVAPIGSPAQLLTSDFSLITSADLRVLFSPRPKDSNKGTYGHVLAIAGSTGHTGAAAMCGLAALRAGAGLVTVASAAPLTTAPELMTAPLPVTPELLKGKTVLAIGPGLGNSPETLDLFQNSDLPMVCDADALNTLAGTDWSGTDRSGKGKFRVLTPHPGEMSRLTGRSVKEIQADRFQSARSLATEREAIIVLKGDRTLIAFPDGRVWVNPTGSPSMATGGTGDILTGLIAGMLAQHPDHRELAVAAAVYLHGLAGELGAAELTEECLIATDLLRFLPHAIRHVQNAE